MGCSFFILCVQSKSLFRVPMYPGVRHCALFYATLFYIPNGAFLLTFPGKKAIIIVCEIKFLYLEFNFRKLKGVFVCLSKK